MIDYSNSNRRNQLLGGLTADTVLWKGKQTTITVNSTASTGIINELEVRYGNDYKVIVKIQKAPHNSFEYPVEAIHKGKIVQRLVLPKTATEVTFNLAFRMIKNKLQLREKEEQKIA